MNAKKVFGYIAAFFAGIFAFICGAILQSKRDTVDSVGDRVDQLKREAEQQQRDNREAIEGIDGALETISEIRKKQKFLEDDSALDEWYCRELCSDNNNSTK